MKPIERSEVLGLGDYEQVRARFRARVVDLKQRRRVAVGDQVTVLFENRDTALLQIQEMIRAERISEEKAILHEIETYNELVPAAGQLSFTLFIEIADREERERILTACAGMERHVCLVVAGERLPATITTRAGLSNERTTAVQYYLVDVPAEAARKFAEGANVSLVVDHPAYRAEGVLSTATVAELAADLDWS